MIRSRQYLRISAILMVVLAGCAKGGSTLDADAAESPTANSPSDAEDSSGGGGSGTSTGNAGRGSNSGGDGNALNASPCGNGVIDPGEDCDGSDLNAVTCENLGFSGGTLSCDPQICMFETSMCTRDMQMGGAGNGM